MLTAGIDMQIDRLEIEVVAWGIGEESWSVDYRVIWGDPLLPDIWNDLDDYLEQSWLHESKNKMRISAACLDTGGTGGCTQAAYDYVKNKRGRRVFAIKGVGGWGRSIVAPPNRKRSGPNQRKLNLFPVGTDEARLNVYKRLGIAEPGKGYCHFPNHYDVEYFKQLTAETLRTRYRKGHPVREWHKTRPRNEALDARVYSLSALKIINPNLEKLTARLLPAEKTEDECQDNEDKLQLKSKSKKAKRSSVGWMRGYS